MRLFSWNCQGLGNPWTVRALHNLVKMKVPQILFLCEIRQDSVCVEGVRCRLGFKGGFNAPQSGGGGGLALLWDDSVQVVIKSFSNSHIDAVVEESGGGNPWRFTGFYGQPESCRRVDSWNLLKSLGNQAAVPWVCAGDFNEIVKQSEKEGGSLRPEWKMRNFREALAEAGLSCLPSLGPKFTWRGRRHRVGWIQERLDRFVANAEWLDLYPSVCSKNLVSSTSDHLPIFLDTNPVAHGFYRKHFKFEAMWLTHPQCQEQVTQAWEGGVERSTMGHINEKIQACKNKLEVWDKNCFGNVTRLLKDKTKQLESLESRPMRGEVGDQLCSLKKEINDLLGKEEIMWRQRSRVQWLREGDRNTKFFHAQANQRKRRNGILGINDQTGVWVSNQRAIARVAVDYFQSIFTSSSPTEEDISKVVAQVFPKVTAEMNQVLCKEYTETEVGEALKQMGPTKAPGPNGMPPLFFQSFWSQIGGEVSKAVLDVLNHGASLQSINHTHLVLIPKKLSPKAITEYRPISLCNVIYKLVSKTLANRLKAILPAIISENQSAFVPGRQIVDNILVAFETLHSLKSAKGRGPGQMALKLNMSKAYDRVEWGFLEGMLRRLGFAEIWIASVMQCITSVSYSVVVNRVPNGLIYPSRGLRQGDSLSPYLFLLCGEGLLALLH